MAHKDYVARGRSKKQAPPPPKRLLPWIRIVVTVTLVAGFSYFLWSIKGTAPENTSNDGAVTEQIQSKEDTMPDIPEEEWEFHTPPYMLHWLVWMMFHFKTCPVLKMRKPVNMYTAV